MNNQNSMSKYFKDHEDGKPIAMEAGFDSHYVLVSEELKWNATNSLEGPKKGVTCRKKAPPEYDELVIRDRDQALPKLKLYFRAK